MAWEKHDLFQSSSSSAGGRLVERIAGLPKVLGDVLADSGVILAHSAWIAALSLALVLMSRKRIATPLPLDELVHPVAVGRLARALLRLRLGDQLGRFFAARGTEMPPFSIAKPINRKANGLRSSDKPPPPRPSQTLRQPYSQRTNVLAEDASTSVTETTEVGSIHIS